MVLGAALCAVIGTLQPGTYDREMGDRSYRVLVPDSACTKPRGLVVALTGIHQKKEWACGTIIEPYAAAFCIIGVCPQGVETEDMDGPISGWNTNDANSFYAQWDRDDVGFIRNIVNELVPEFSIPSDKVFAFGFSFGGGMTFRLACETANLFSGFAVSGMVWDDETSGKGKDYHDECSVAVPFWQGSGTRDYYYGHESVGHSHRPYTYDYMYANWKMYSEDVLGCNPDSRATTYETSGVRCEQYTDCPGVAMYCSALTGRHWTVDGTYVADAHGYTCRTAAAGTVWLGSC